MLHQNFRIKFPDISITFSLTSFLRHGAKSLLTKIIFVIKIIEIAIYYIILSNIHHFKKTAWQITGHQNQIPWHCPHLSLTLHFPCLSCLPDVLLYYLYPTLPCISPYYLYPVLPWQWRWVDRGTPVPSPDERPTGRLCSGSAEAESLNKWSGSLWTSKTRAMKNFDYTQKEGNTCYSLISDQLDYINTLISDYKAWEM